MKPTGLPWQRHLGKWILRLFCAMMIFTAVNIVIFDSVGWETMFDPPLSKREEAVARIGVLFDHGFQLAYWPLILLVSELGDVVMLRVALGSAAFGMTVNGIYGLQSKGYGFYQKACDGFFQKACDEFGICPTADLGMMANVIGPIMVGLPLIAFLVSFTEKQPEAADDDYQQMT